jgi:hypothetical protein
MNFWHFFIVLNAYFNLKPILIQIDSNPSTPYSFQFQFQTDSNKFQFQTESIQFEID